MNKILGAAIIIIGIIMGIELHSVMGLKHKLSQLKSDYDRASRLASKSALLEEQLAGINKERDVLKKKIPINDRDPLNLSREVSSLAISLGFSHLSFEVVPPDSSTTMQAMSGGRNIAGRNTPSVSSISKIGLRMKAECDYLQLLQFLDRIQKLSRLVIIKELEIIRKKALLPRQEVILRLEAYSFTS